MVHGLPPTLTDLHVNRLLGRLRKLLGRCDLGEYGCNRRPVGTWTLDSAAFRFCRQHWDELREGIADADGGYLGEWVEKSVMPM